MSDAQDWCFGWMLSHFPYGRLANRRAVRTFILPDCACGRFRAFCSVFSEEKKLSIALSQTLPGRLIEQVTPLSAIRRWNCALGYWPP